MRSIEMSGLMVMPKSMENDPPQSASSSGRVKPMHQEEVDEKAHQEAHEPRVVVEHPERGNHQADKSDSGAGRQGRDGRPIEAARIFVATLPPTKVLANEKLLPANDVGANENPRAGAG